MVMNLRKYLAASLVAVAATATATTSLTATAGAAAGTAKAGHASRHAYRQQDLQRDLAKITAVGVPGVLADVHIGGRQLRATGGVASLTRRTPVNGRGYFRIGSNTKTFLSVVVLQLAAAHRLSLDDTVDHWLPGVVSGNGNDGTRITVRELLQHTSGLHNYTVDLQAQITSVKAYRKLEFHQFSRADLLKIALSHKPDFAPGAGWRYSNTNYVLLGMIIEKVTHRPWASEVRSRVSAPLGLHHTFAPGRSVRLPQPHATGYLIFSKDIKLNTTRENMSWADAAGALVSNAADLTRFWQAIGRGTLLGPAQRQEMQQTVPATGGDTATVPGSRYGLGIFRIPLTCGGYYWSHEGDVPGYNTIGAVSANGKRTVVLSLNSNVDDPVLAAEYGLVDHVMCSR
jgi:D-alanyl-D-alanine carboxypeptidase